MDVGKTTRVKKKRRRKRVKTTLVLVLTAFTENFRRGAVEEVLRSEKKGIELRVVQAAQFISVQPLSRT